MAAHMVFVIVVSQFLFSSNLVASKELRCEKISISDLARERRFQLQPSRKMPIVAICIHGDKLSLSRLWGSVKVELEFEKTHVHFYEAESCSALNPANHTWASVFQSLVTSSNFVDRIIFKHSPFKTSCSATDLGIKQDARVAVTAEFQVIDWQFPAAFLAGLVIFYNAERLSRNSLFFYSSGVSVGLLMSLLLLVYILHKLIPGRGGAYAVLIGGWSLGAYLIQWALGNLKDLLLNHNQWVIGYLVVVGLISFCVCYYYGPVTSDRGLDLIRWMLQAIGLTLLYMGTRSDEVSLALVVTVLLSHVIRNSGILWYFVKLLPRNWLSYRVYYFFFPPKRKFLSEDEFILQGCEETRVALEHLREYCNSPECNAWRVVSRLKHPTRFAHFVSTGQHFMDDEIKTYDEDPSPWLTSDSDDEDDGGIEN